jgi:hypothetical protein
MGSDGTDRPVNLQSYFLELLESQGALVEVPAFGLAEALLPEELARQLEVPEHLLLAFDCEVAQEVPGADLITWGSPLLERAVRLGLSLGRVSKKYVGGRLSIPSNLLQKAERRLTFVRCRRPQVGPAVLVRAEVLLFEFLVRFMSDEKEERLYSVAVDGVTARGEINHLKPALQGIFLAPEAPELEALPPAPHCGYARAYAAAKEALRRELAADLEAFRRRMGRYLAEEERRLETYYGSALAELEGRAQRLEAADPRRERLAQKMAATRTEAARRLEDVRQKYQVRLEAELDGLRVYVLAKAAFTLELQHKTGTVSLPLHYNLATNDLELPICPACNRPYDTVHIRPDGTAACPACAG